MYIKCTSFRESFVTMSAFHIALYILSSFVRVLYKNINILLFSNINYKSTLIQISHKVDYLLANKLYLHPFDHVKGRRPATGQSDVSIVFSQ